MAFLFGTGPSPSNTKTPVYTGMQLQTSAYGIPVPVIYGTARAGWNLGDYVNFKQTNTPQSSGGKGGVIGGGGGKGATSSTTSYNASVLGIICEGPITGVYSSWSSQTQHLGTPNYDIFLGGIGQTPWSYLSTAYPSHALTYSGFAYAAAENMDLGSSANLPNMNWEVEGFLQGTAPGTYGGNGCQFGGDADPSQVVPDILTNGQYGVDFPAARVGQVVNNNEARNIPGSGPFTVTVNNAAAFEYNINVVSGTTIFKCVASNPQLNQYSYNVLTGIYTFNSSNAGQAINIRYVSITNMVDYQNFCLASGLWISPVYSSQTQASSVLDDIATATYSEIVWSSGIFQMIPRGTMNVSANGYNYFPQTDPLFSLGIDDFMANTGSAASVTASSASSSAAGASSTDDPITITRVRKSDQINDVKLEVLDRANQYATAIVEATDMALIDKYGRRGNASQALHMFCDLNAGNVSAHLQLQDEYILNTYCFQLDERYCLLDPMDPVEVTDPNFPDLTNVAVRILDLVENDDGTIIVTAEEYPGTLGTVPEFNLNTGQGLIQDFNVDPGDAAEPAIFDVPVQLAQVLGLETWLATCSKTANPNWGGCDIYLSTDGTTYAKRGTLNSASRIGVLTSTFPSGADPDTLHTLAVDLSQSFGVIEGGTQNDADTDTTLCFVDGEYVSYQQATLTATYKYNLGCNGSPSTGYLRRGQWGSQISSHPLGSLFVRLDENIFTIPYTAEDVGRTIHIKMVSFNIFGAGYQDLASVTAYTHIIDGPPTIYAPENLSVTSAPLGLNLKWLNAPNVGIAAVEIWRSADNTWAHASHIADAGSYATFYNDQTAIAGTAYWYWIRCRDIAGNEGDWEPVNTGPGMTNTTGQVNTGDIANQAITQTLIANGAVGANQIQSGALLAVLLAESLNPVVVVSSLPANNSQGNIVFLTTDKQLYRWNSATSSWTLAVPAVNVTGQLTASQIASITAAQLTGQITTTQIANNSISTPLLQAAAVSTANLAAGAVVTASIASGAITTATLAAGAVTTSILATNAVTANKMDVNSVTAGTIAVGAVNASAIVVNNIIVTGHLVANAVTASSVSVGGSTAIASGAGYTTLTSVTQSLTGTGDVLVQFTDYITWSVNGPRGFYQIVDDLGHVIMNNGYGGGSCPDFISSAGTGLDTSGRSGTVTYYLQANWTAGANQPTSQQGALIISELKK